MLNAIAKPFGWLMMRLYELTGNYGLAVILFALLVKLILLPFQLKSKRSMMQQQRLNPQVQALQKKYAGNQQKINEETQKLYKEEKVNPMSGCFWSFIPFPIIIALYQAIRYPITIMMGISSAVLGENGAVTMFLQEFGEKLGYEAGNAAYSQIAQSKVLTENWSTFKDYLTNNSGVIAADIEAKFRAIDYHFLGMDLSQRPAFKWIFSGESWSDPSYWLPMLGLFLIPIVAAVLTFISTKVGMALQKQQQQQQGQDDATKSMSFMTYLGPIMTLYFAFVVPGSLGLYWIASSLFGIIQDLILNKRLAQKYAMEDAEFNARMAEREKRLEEKRQETERLRAMNATERNENTSSRKKRAAQRESQKEKAKEYEKKKNNVTEEFSPSRVGERRYARGRAYDPDRYSEDGSVGDDEDIQTPEAYTDDGEELSTYEPETDLTYDGQEEPEQEPDDEQWDSEETEEDEDA
ncbi:MAG: membrane protein insertase YidC [Oscillospiraceae bacterium]|nr:membrane protein insertase YidC [Oscillospiraceae bacterium]